MPALSLWRAPLPLVALAIVSVGLVAVGCNSPGTASSSSESTGASQRSSLTASSKAELQQLYARTPGAETLAKEAKGILVFPEIVKGGLVVGGGYGEGTLFKNGQPVGYYRSTMGSYGLQAGVQKFGYALFFMTDNAMRSLDDTKGWEIGVGPSVVIVDEGAAKALTTTTARSDVYAFIFDQRGLMAGIGLQGSKISRLN